MAAAELSHDYYKVAMRLTNPITVLDALIDSLQSDPFYVAISKEFKDDAARRRTALARYFDYSMTEGHAAVGWSYGLIHVLEAQQCGCFRSTRLLQLPRQSLKPRSR